MILGISETSNSLDRITHLGSEMSKLFYCKFILFIRKFFDSFFIQLILTHYNLSTAWWSGVEQLTLGRRVWTSRVSLDLRIPCVIYQNPCQEAIPISGGIFSVESPVPLQRSNTLLTHFTMCPSQQGKLCWNFEIKIPNSPSTTYLSGSSLSDSDYFERKV